MKTCRVCCNLKNTTEFRKDSRAKDGLNSCCTSCMKHKDALYRAANPEKIKSIRDSWNAANPGSQKAYNKAWYAANSEKQKAVSAKYYAANPDKCKAVNTKWHAANLDKVRASAVRWRAKNLESYRQTHRIVEHNRRARKTENGGTLSAGLADKLFRLQMGKCACGCRQPLGDKYHLDHRMPVALGGSNTDDNMQLLRSTCNQQKHAKHPVDFMQSRGFLL